MATTSSTESVVPHSTAGTSPAPSPAAIKRPARTYGRKKSPLRADDASVEAGLNFKHPQFSRLQTNPRNLTETVDASMDNEGIDVEKDSETTKPDEKFQWSWKNKLRAIDNSDDEDTNTSSVGIVGLGDFGNPTLLASVAGDVGNPTSVRSQFPTVMNDIFNSSSPSRQGSGEPSIMSDAESSDRQNQGPQSSPPATTPEGAQSTPDTGPGDSAKSAKWNATSDEMVRSVVPVVSPSLLVSRRIDGARKKSGVKKPTKKDREETIKESARMASERDVNIKSNSKKLYSLQTLFQTVKTEQPQSAVPKLLDTESSLQSDPIMAFSSPELSKRSPPCRVPVAGPSKLPELPMRAAFDLQSDDDDLPDNFLGEPKKRVSLQELKRRALAEKRAKSHGSDEDDSDLEIVSTKAIASRSTERRASSLRKRHLLLAGINPRKPGTGELSKGKANKQGPTREEMDKVLWNKVVKEQREIDSRKKEEFLKVGGRLHEEEVERSELNAGSALKVYAEQGLKTSNVDSQVTLVDDDDESDDEWKPEGSASPVHGSAALEHDDEDIAMASGMNDSVDTEDAEDEAVLRIARPKRIVVVDSDEENDENSAPKPVRHASRQRITSDDSLLETDIEHDGSTPFSEDGMGTDKENNASLVFDRSDDKENSRVPRFGSLSSTDSFEDIHPPPPGPQSRQPLQEILSSPETPKTRALGRTNLTQLFEAQLSEPRRTPELQLSPFAPQRSDSEGFSQFSQGGVVLSNSSPRGGLADLFEARTQVPSSSDSPKKDLLAEPFVGKLKGAGPLSLSLTQDVLQPAFQAEEEVLRKANRIIEKEQDLVLDVAFEPQPSGPNLYVNDEGFLTQTRPEDAPTPTQMRSLLGTPMEPGPDARNQRSPLATLSFSDPTQSSPVEHGRFKRLRRRSESPSERPVVVNAKKRRNAFDVLGHGAQTEAERKRRRLEKSEFVEEEAHESDDEGGFWGRGAKKDDEDDEDLENEELDKAVEGLVDDQVMDDDTLAEERVLEKFKEQAEEDDQRIEQKANDIVHGEWRKKHKDGGFMTDESDDEMDDDARKARRRLRRERMKREDVAAMEANPETKAFAAAYKSTVEEEDNEFAHLAQDETDRILGSLDGSRHDDEEDEEDYEMDQEETIDASDIRRMIRERAQHPRERREDERLDFSNTSWLDEEDNDEQMDVRVKTVKPSVKKPAQTPQHGLNPSDMDDALESQEPAFRPATQQLERAKTWAKREERNRAGTTARTSGKMAVTSNPVKSGAGSLRRGGKTINQTVAEPSKPKPAVKKAQSMLLGVDRSGRFS